MGFNQNSGRLKIVKIESTGNAFFNDLGIKEGDELVSVNGKNITFQNARTMFGSVKNEVKKGDEFEIVVARYDANGKESKETLKAKITETKASYDFQLSVIENPTDKQTRLLNAWLGK